MYKRVVERREDVCNAEGEFTLPDGWTELNGFLDLPDFDFFAGHGGTEEGGEEAGGKREREGGRGKRLECAHMGMDKSVNIAMSNASTRCMFSSVSPQHMCEGGSGKF